MLALAPRLGSRRIDISGLIIAENLDQVLQFKERLSRIRRGTLVVTERAPGISRLADVRRLDVQYTDHAPHVSGYSLVVTADDPLRYSVAAQNLMGATTLINRGDATAFPVLELVGPMTPRIEHADGVWQMTAIPSGARRRVELRTGDVWNLATNRRVFGVASGPPPRVPAGGAQWSVSGLGTAPSANRQVSRFEAWT